jgi:aryl-alcohol dehydrogenase-like predicted oxidoreductase
MIELPGKEAPLGYGVERRQLGSTGLVVSALGLGTGRIGGPEMDEAEAGRLIGRALDLGITLFDAARSYGAAEGRLGRALSGHRSQVVLSTKVGYGIEGVPDWTWEAVARGVDEALVRLRTTWIDIVHLHSCPREVLERGEVARALEDAVRGGKVRHAAYSGEEEALRFALRSGAFQSVQASLSVCDQRVLRAGLAEARARGVGFLAKRPLADAPWRFRERPEGDEAEPYWLRLAAMGIGPGDLSWTGWALRFSAFQPGVSAVLVGTRNAAHLEEAVKAMAQGPLPSATREAIEAAFLRCDQGWTGRI